MKLFDIFILSLMAVAGASAQTVESFEGPEPVISEKEALINEIEKLAQAPRKDFGAEIKRMNEKISEYAVARKKECMGEYSSIEITANGETQKAENQLSKEEKKLCLLELIRLRKKFTDSLYKARKNHLLRQHKEQLENLERSRIETIKEIEVMSGKLK